MNSSILNLNLSIYQLGNIGNGSFINLNDNNLTRLDWGVFLEVLEQMAPYETNDASITINGSKI